LRDSDGTEFAYERKRCWHLLRTTHFARDNGEGQRAVTQKSNYNIQQQVSWKRVGDKGSSQPERKGLFEIIHRVISGDQKTVVKRRRVSSDTTKLFNMPKRLPEKEIRRLFFGAHFC